MKIERALKFVPILIALFLGAVATPVSATLLTFNSRYVVTSSTAVTTTSSALVDDTQASQTFSLTASKTVLVIYQANSVYGSTMYQTGMQNAISVDSTDRAMSWDSPYNSTINCTRNTVFWIGTLTSGSHTIKGRFASNTNGQTVTVSNRVLLIYVLDGDEFRYVDDPTTQTTSSSTLGNDPSASFTFTPSGSCKAVILYNISNSGASEDTNGKKAAIRVGTTDYSQAEKSPYDINYADSVFTVWALGLSASSTTVTGRFASTVGGTVTIHRRHLGILLFADTTLLDTINSDTQVTTNSAALVDDSQATITRPTTDTRELLVVAMGTKRAGVASNERGECYGIKIDSNDRANSRGSASSGAATADSAATAYAENLAAGSHTIQGRFATNTSEGYNAVISSRRIVALWLPVPKLLTFNSKYVVTSQAAVATTSSSLQDDTQASQTFSLTASQTVLAIYQANSVNGATMPENGMQNAIRVDSTDYANSWDSGGTNYATRNTVFWIGTLASGSHTIKGRFASNTNGSTATISNRVLLIYILNGDAFQYLDSTTTSTSSSATLANDPAASFAFTPSGSCKALILYNISNSGATELYAGKKAAIRVGSTDYSQAEKSPGNSNYADSVFTVWAQSLSAASTTVTGRFASTESGTTTIHRRQLGILMFADTTLLDTVNSDTQVNTTSATLVDDAQATISRTTADSRELLIVAMGTKRWNTPSSAYSHCYGIKVDSTDRTNSRSSNYNDYMPESAATAWAETLSAAAHTIKGRFSNNTGSNTAVIDSRRIVALWLPTGQFNYRRQITILDSMTVNPSPCSTNLTDFPLLIKLSGNWLKTRAVDPANGRIENVNGYDIVFRQSDGINPLDHEIERYDGSAGELIAWVRIPTLPYSGDTNIYMYYGNGAIFSPTENPIGVWDSNYLAVYHLNQSPAGTVYDSTGNNVDLTSGGGMGGGNLVAGRIGYGISFDGSDDRLVSSNNTITATNFALEAWISSNDWTDWHTIVEIDDNVAPEAFRNFAANDTGRIGVDDGTFYQLTNVQSGATWRHVLARHDTGVTPRLQGFLNGSPTGLGASMVWGSITGRAVVGAWWSAGDTTFYDFWNGILDEIRISNIPRNDCWIRTEYNNMNSTEPGTYLTLGAEGPAAPTAVKLTSFAAIQYSDGVLLKWKTGYEVDNLGFHIYREENGERVRLTPEPVAGSALIAGSRTALTAGHHYHWWDASLSPQSSSLGTVKYWLKDIDLNGTHTMHGPVTPVFSREPIPDKQRPELLSERGMRLQDRYHHYWKVRELKEKLKTKNVNRYTLLGKTNNDSRITNNKMGGTLLKARRADPPTSRPKADLLVQQYLASRAAVKILVREEGWYQVSQPELVVAGLSPRVNPKDLQLYVDGKEQPIRITGKRDGVFGPGDAIEFYGTGLDTASTDTRVYWLIEGIQAGKRIGNHVFNPPFRNPHSAFRNSFASFPHTVQIKDRWIYLPAIKNGEEENFFGAVVYGSGVDQLLGVKHLDLAASEDALLEVVLQGATNVSHQVKVLINKEEVGEVVFEGQAKGLLQVEVPQALLLEGDNLVSFIPLGGEMDVSLVDSIRLTYWHTYTADDNGLRLTAQGGSHLTVNGFSESRIRVFDITDSNDVIEILGKVESLKGGYAISFRVPGTEQRTLLAMTEEKVKSPEGIISNQPSSWHQSKDGYDLVIVTHRDFLDALQPLKKLRESQGLKVALIDVEDLYDEFSFGNKSPRAIKDFLASAKANWKRSPRFVLLVGDASFNPKNYFGLGDLNFVPTKLIDTVYMETASDDWFVDLNNDGLPEMAIGRLPVQTAEEASVVVSKTIGYERSGKKNEALLVADRVDNLDDFNFEGASEEIRGLLPSSLVVRKIYRSQFGSDSQVNGVLLSAINQGPLLVNFIGHGSIEIWRGMLSSDDADALINGMRLPFFVNMTCLNGYFQDPYSETLGEALLKAKGGGAIAIWTSSGLTEPDKQAVMNKELIRLLFGRELLTLGEATARAKASVSDQDIRKTWILFGDPTTRLKP